MLALLLLTTISCNHSTSESSTNTAQAYTSIQGRTMGTTYSITYRDRTNHQAAIDSLLLAINREVNTYDSTAYISQFNAQPSYDIPATANHFWRNYEAADSVYRVTEGAFDPTVMPLVRYWGFGPDKRPVLEADADSVRRMLAYVGMQKLDYQAPQLRKQHPRAQLDFSAIAKGYAVDAITDYLNRNGITDYLVEVGGETRTNGLSPKGTAWVIGINTPQEGADPRTDFEAVIKLSGQAIATSGNYRNYYEIAGRKYAHTINPTTGYPEMGNLLSASVISDNCMMADAYATGFMTMGIDKAFALASAVNGLEAYFIYTDGDNILTKSTAGFEALIWKE